MNVLGLVWRSVRLRRLPSALTAASVAVGVMLVCAVILLQSAMARHFEEPARGYSLAIGAPGSALQLVLATVYQIDKSPGLIPMDLWTELEADESVSLAVPYALGDTFRGFRVIGTTDAIFDAPFPLADPALAEGRAFSFDRERLRELLAERGATLDGESAHDAPNDAVILDPFGDSAPDLTGRAAGDDGEHDEHDDEHHGDDGHHDDEHDDDEHHGDEHDGNRDDDEHHDNADEHHDDADEHHGDEHDGNHDANEHYDDANEHHDGADEHHDDAGEHHDDAGEHHDDADEHHDDADEHHDDADEHHDGADEHHDDDEHGHHAHADVPMEAVVGAEVARRLGVSVGSEIEPTHGLEGAVHDEEHLWEVVGILGKTGTPLDQVVFINLESFYAIDDHEGATLPDSDQAALSALLVFPRPGVHKVMLLSRLNRRPDLQVADVPAEVQKLFALIGGVDQILLVVAGLVVLLGVFAILLSLFTTM
ncbi:MAG: hypothetical protein AAF645_17785, partial [Myxococcota bacterium]